MREKIKLSAGTALYISEMGYNNFYYPTSKLANIISDEEVEVLGWINFNGLTPVKVTSSNIDGLCSNSQYIVMWKE